MNFISPYSTVSKLISIYSEDSSSLILEIPNIVGSTVINISNSKEDLKLEAESLSALGILNYVMEEKDSMDQYLQELKKLEVSCFDAGIFNPLNPFEIVANITYSTDGEEESISIEYDLQISSREELPENFGELISSLTTILCYFKHRLIESNLGLN
jgi:hypothetical protein